MKKGLLLLTLVSTMLFTACKKGESNKKEDKKEEETEETTKPTEGNIVIADNPGDKVKYDDKSITAKSFSINATLVYFYPGSKQITVQSVEKDGIFNKYTLGLNFPATLPAVGVKTSAINGSLPLVGLNIFDGGDLYYYSCMSGSYTIEAMDDHNITVLYTDIEMKQSFDMGFDKANKRYTIKSFRVKGKY
ncbi:MAG: hypothetical protein EOP51_19995 [Sphingobacteriales bacterium]|nr:MAG: hypothetical protein EOP51_19995 [Sphingobacteriales bacterium]